MFAITGVLGAAPQDFSSLLPEGELRQALVDCLSDLLGT